MSSQPVINRGKHHKGGKVVSLSILWVAAGLLVVMAVSQTITHMFNGVQQQYDHNVVNVVSQDDAGQPAAAKIGFNDGPVDAVAEDYVDVWAKLDAIAASAPSPAARNAVIELFLEGLSFKAETHGGIIVSKADGLAVSPSTLQCYMNAYVPDRPYIKANCPSH
jgi:hypothetical protein